MFVAGVRVVEFGSNRSRNRTGQHYNGFVTSAGQNTQCIKPCLAAGLRSGPMGSTRRSPDQTPAAWVRREKAKGGGRKGGKEKQRLFPKVYDGSAPLHVTTQATSSAASVNDYRIICIVFRYFILFLFFIYSFVLNPAYVPPYFNKRVCKCDIFYVQQSLRFGHRPTLCTINIHLNTYLPSQYRSINEMRSFAVTFVHTSLFKTDRLHCIAGSTRKPSCR